MLLPDSLNNGDPLPRTNFDSFACPTGGSVVGHSRLTRRMRWDRWLYLAIMVEFLSAPALGLINGLYDLQLLGLSMPQLVRGVLLGPISLCLVQVENPRRWRLRTLYPILALALYSSAITLVAGDAMSNLIATFRLLYPCLLGVSIYVLTTRGFLSARTITLVAWYWLLGYCVLQWFGAQSGEVSHDIEGSAMAIGHSASSADGLTFIIPFFFLSGRFRTRDCLGIAIALVSVSFTMRRTAMLGCMAATFAGLLARGVKRKSQLRDKLAAIALPTIVCLIVVAAFSMTDWGTGFQSRLNDIDPSQDNAGSGRIGLWKFAVNYCCDRWMLWNIIGEGQMALSMAYFNYSGKSIMMHNEWLEIVGSYGIVGLLFYGAFYWRLAVVMLKARCWPNSSMEVLAAALAGIVVVGMTQTVLINPTSVPAYIVIGFVLARYHGKQALQSHASRQNRTSQSVPECSGVDKPGAAWVGATTRLPSSVALKHGDGT